MINQRQKCIDQHKKFFNRRDPRKYLTHATNVLKYSLTQTTPTI